jgi:transcriptional regulator with XRE-family HTH domain
MNNEALSNSELARLSGLTDKTVRKIRKNEQDGSLNSQNKIVKGLNLNPNKIKKEDYGRLGVFPNSGA